MGKVLVPSKSINKVGKGVSLTLIFVLFACPLWASSVSVGSSTISAKTLEQSPSAATTTAAAIAQPSSNKPSKFDGLWKFVLSAEDSRDEMNQSSGVFYKGLFELRYTLAPWLVLNGAPIVVGKSGHIQADSDIGPQSADSTSLLVRNATADFLFLQNSRIQVGVASQKEVHSPLLIDDRGFPAARIQLRAGESAYFQWQAFTQAAVPTSASLTTNSREFEPTPSFSSSGASAGIRSTNTEWKNQISYFEYKSLPTNIATSSGLLGNSVITTNSTDAQFVYNYRGLELQSDLSLRLGRRWQSKVKVVGLQNSAAPKGLNSGMLGQFEIGYLLNSRTTISPFAQSFRVEPDAAVAAYSSGNWHPNTIGYRGGLKGEFAQGFALKAAGGERAPIFENPAQYKERFIELTLETIDAKF